LFPRSTTKTNQTEVSGGTLNKAEATTLLLVDNNTVVLNLGTVDLKEDTEDLRVDMEVHKVDMVDLRAGMVGLKEDMAVLREDTEDLPKVTLSSNNLYVFGSMPDAIEFVH
jgi:hypothetical protein